MVINVNSDASNLSKGEQNVLEDICSRFSEINARDISLESQKEKGWIDNHESKNYIDYSYAFDFINTLKQSR